MNQLFDTIITVKGIDIVVVGPVEEGVTVYYVRTL
jgi:2-keto-3-deoxy-L-rhamnonate aldolase RhmA